MPKIFKDVSLFLCCLFALFPFTNHANPELNASLRTSNEGKGPYKELILRGGILINGEGAPPQGPVDIVIKNNHIQSIYKVGSPGAPIREQYRPRASADTQEIDVTGMYILPGFIDMHGHIGASADNIPADYVFKLWLAHGITSVREPGSFMGVDWVLDHTQKSEKNAIVAPRIFPHVAFGSGSKARITTPEAAKSWVQYIANKGAKGIKFFGARPEVMQAAIAEAKKTNLKTMMHHAQLHVMNLNALDSARMGLDTLEHWYGIPEAMFEDKIIQHYPSDYNYANEAHRFEQAGRLWQQAAAPGSTTWNKVRDTLIAHNLTLDPTFNVYEASRDLMREQNAPWHKEYTLPTLWEFFKPSRHSHGSYWFDWTTANEIAWKKNYQLWMQFINDYKNHGGRVTAGSDSGYIYKIYGFGFIRELELLQEAGFHPLEVIQAASLNGAEALGMGDKIGSIREGKFADMLIVEHNPLENFKLLYGTGHVRLGDNNQLETIGGVKYTIKDGIVYDAKALLQDVRLMVAKAKKDAESQLSQ